MNTATFWSHVTITTTPRHMPDIGPCWEWQAGRLGPLGYGVCTIDGARLLAHRAAWTIVAGPIPDGLLVCHHCDNKLCVRPTHLFLGTAKDNLADWSAKLARMGGDRPHYQYRARDVARMARPA